MTVFVYVIAQVLGKWCTCGKFSKAAKKLTKLGDDCQMSSWAIELLCNHFGFFCRGSMEILMLTQQLQIILTNL